MSFTDLVKEMKNCSACKMRAGCIQVVTPTGQFDNPLLLCIGECPGEEEDEKGIPFIGKAGQCLRDVLRNTKILNQNNTSISNVLSCRPPGNKFPKDDCPNICVAKWLWKEIELLAPKRMLLLGGVPLKYVAGLDGITANRGKWYNVRGIRTMATYHPSYVLRCDNEIGGEVKRQAFEGDIAEVAAEIAVLQKTPQKESLGQAQNHAFQVLQQAEKERQILTASEAEVISVWEEENQ